MENRPAPLRSRRVCRFCLTETEPLSFIYERDHIKPFQVPLTLQIMSCVAIEVYAADGMPQMICVNCRWNLDRSYKFKLQCKKADEALRAYPMTGVLPRPFPPIANDQSETGAKRGLEQRASSEQNKKPRVDNGDRERQRERERERERQQEKQNIKSDRNDLYKEDREAESDGDQGTADEKDERKLEPGEIRVHACDQCDRTFPLRQSLQLHIQRAHRDRNSKCTECDRMFFTKYDLAKHMLTHSSDKPFSCTICSKTFSRANLLQRHEKVHRDDMRFGCQHCDREFFTPEELEKHEDLSHKTTKPYQCNICNKRFTYKQGLERHEMLHNEDKSFVCEYCKEAFRTSTKLARHLSTHSGHRPYLCKLCPRKFLLSHHLTRHMRSHSVEKRHVCEDCGKAFKRKESLEVHQLTHTKRSSMGLTCDVCQESCRNRADYVTHIKQHIEAGEKMGPDGLQPDKDKIETETEEEEEEEEPYSDGDDDYEPPAYVVKKLPKIKKQPAESDDEESEDRANLDKEDRKEQVVFVRGKDGNIVKKTIKTLMPIQRRDVQDSPKPGKTGSNAQQQQQQTITKKQQQQQQQGEDAPSKGSSRGGGGSGVDDTEAEVQKIVASVFKEHKIPLKHTNIPQEQLKESPSTTSLPTNQVHTRAQSAAALAQKDEKAEIATGTAATASSTPKSVNTVKVIKRIVVRKPLGGNGATPETGTPVMTSVVKEDSGLSAGPSPSGSATKVTKRVIVRRIIRQGDTTREVIMNPDGTIIDPAELAKLPTGNVVKRVVVKKALDKNKSLVQVIQPGVEQRQGIAASPGASQTKTQSDPLLGEAPKFELKTSQASSAVTPSEKNVTVASAKVETRKPSSPKGNNSGGDQETKEKLERLEKRVEQQRIKIEELQARKQQECEAIDEMLPERHDESEDEQQLPLKRVFVKRKQSIYDEEQDYTDTDGNETNVKKENLSMERSEADVSHQTETVESSIPEPPITRSRQLSITNSKVYTNKKVIFLKNEEPSEVEDMSRELSSILDSADSVAKIQENVLSNLSQISALGETGEKDNPEMETETVAVVQEDAAAATVAASGDSGDATTAAAAAATAAAATATATDVNPAAVPLPEPMDQDSSHTEDETEENGKVDESLKEVTVETSGSGGDGGGVGSSAIEIAVTVDEQVITTQEDEQGLAMVQQDISNATDIFETSDSPLICPKPDPNIEESVIELSQETINLNETNESQDSLEDKLSQMEG